MAFEGAVRSHAYVAPSSTGAGLSRIPTRAPGHRRVERAMGTMISLYAPAGGASAEAADEAFAWLHEIDRRFSPFRADSEVSRLTRGEISTADVSADLIEVLEIAEIVEVLSDGAFDIRGHRGDGAPDPTGVVKGWAVDRAGDILSAGGVERFSLGAGGDVLVHGGRAAGVSWRIGVAHPDYGDAVALTLEADDLAVATSGTTERGRHIVDGRTGVAADELLTLTVAGPSLARADAYATAAFAMGQLGVRWVDSLPGYSAAGITHYGRLITTRGLQQYQA
jgi:thiamine biosynthesis lipoprotein